MYEEPDSGAFWFVTVFVVPAALYALLALYHFVLSPAWAWLVV